MRNGHPKRLRHPVSLDRADPGTSDTSPGPLATAYSATVPQLFCRYGFPSYFTAFAIALLADVILQLYAWFMTWRLAVRLQHEYAALTGVQRLISFGWLC